MGKRFDADSTDVHYIHLLEFSFLRNESSSVRRKSVF